MRTGSARPTFWRTRRESSWPRSSAPEHGIAGVLDTTAIGNSRDAATGAPIYSVYGDGDAKRRPTDEEMAGVDAIVYDIQDMGARFYTYESTLGYFLEAAAKAGKEIVVLDRPNPIGGAYVQGPMLDAGRESFVGYWRTPVRHGMTVGELAGLFNGERTIGAKLSVVRMEGWLRGDWFDSTGRVWINPSPNMRSLTEAELYPGIGMIEVRRNFRRPRHRHAFRACGRAVDRRRCAGRLFERARDRRRSLCAGELHAQCLELRKPIMRRREHHRDQSRSAGRARAWAGDCGGARAFVSQRFQDRRAWTA